jgi:voltage-gated potassium channel
MSTTPQVRPISAEERRLLRLEPQFVPFLIASLLPVLTLPYANSTGTPLERLVTPVVMTVLVAQSLRTLPRVDGTPLSRYGTRLFQLLGILGAAGCWLDQLPAIWAQIPVRMAVMTVLSLFLTLSAIRLVRLLARVARVNVKVLAGAAAGYVHLGLTGGVVASLIQLMHPGTFAFGTYGSFDRHEDVLERLIYYAYVTASSLGYGDVLPANAFGERFSVLLSLASTLYMSLLVGLVLSRYIATQGIEIIESDLSEEFDSSRPPQRPS